MKTRVERDCDTRCFFVGEPDTTTTAMVLYSDNEEAVEWVNMCWRKVCLVTFLTLYYDSDPASSDMQHG